MSFDDGVNFSMPLEDKYLCKELSLCALKLFFKDNS
jgi:hypothetical protein